MHINIYSLLLSFGIWIILSNNSLSITVDPQADEAIKAFPVIDFNPDLQNTMTAINWNAYKNQALARLTHISAGPDVTPPNPSGAAKSAIKENNGINEQAVIAYNTMATTYNSDPEYYYDVIRGVAYGDDETSDNSPEVSSPNSISSSISTNDYDSDDTAEKTSKSGEA